jgi:hypothetical protein
MSKPKPEDWLAYSEWLKQTPDETRVAPRDPIDLELAQMLEGVNLEQEVFKAEEWDRFFKEYELDLKAEDLIAKEKSKISERRIMLLNALTFLEWAQKSGDIPTSTKFDALFKRS